MTLSEDESDEPRANILLVDDQPANLLALDSMLAGPGQNLVKASGGEEALRRLLREDFAVVLMDVQMPGLDGFETAKLIRGRERSRYTPIVFLTAYERPDFPALRAYSLGAVDFLLKPLNADVLRAKVAVFVELFRKTEEVKRQGERLRLLERRDFERRLAEQRYEETRRLNEELERRVAERTAALEAANRELQKEASEHKQTAAELARSNRELEQFAYVASHDLKEPLRKIRLYLELLERQYRGRLDERADQFIASAVGAAGRLQALVNDWLAYARAGGRSKALEPTDCAAVLDQALLNLEPAIRESGALVTHGPLPAVRGDGPQLVQLFQNLIGNALKFRREPTPAVHVETTRQGGLWRFTVRDNGIGIDRRHADRIFVLFERLHGREYAGTGIGLAVCKKIVERHGGEIGVESQPREGATFWFTLPAIEGQS
ncbi:MAG TPA: ATP-binding protein [Gemmataceae bacterium]|nr:ATP-binding protein [Gemmataceae bacterium]